MKNLKINLNTTLGLALIIVGAAGFVRYGIQSANHYNASLSNLGAVLLGLFGIFYGLGERHKKLVTDFFSSTKGNLLAAVLAGSLSYIYISVALDSARIFDYVLGILALVVCLSSFKKGLVSLLKK